jgi:hypothetical protein
LSNRIAILGAIAAIVVVAIGRYAFNRAPAPAAGTSVTSAQDQAAKAASRAMTFTQPKAPAQ